MADCTEAIRVDQHFVPAHLIRGGILLRTGNYEGALAEFDRAIKANPRYARAYNDRGVAHSKLGKLDEAIVDFTKAIELSPGQTQAFANRGNAHVLKGNYSDALRDFTQAILLDSKYASTYCVARGQVEVAQGRFGQALADYSVALALDPGNKAARSARADARARMESDFVVSVDGGELAVVEEAPVTDGIEIGEPITEAGSMAPTPGGTQNRVTLDISGMLIDRDRESPPERVHPRTQLANPVSAPDSAPDYELEQQRIKYAQQQQRLRELAEKAAELRKRNEVEESSRQAARQKKRRRTPDEDAERMRRVKQVAVISIGILFVGYWLFQAVWYVIPRAKNPFRMLPADQLVAEYAKDSIAADDKYADQMMSIRGKVIVVADKKLRVRNTTPRVYFDVPGQKEDLRIECVFEDPDLVLGLKGDVEYTIVGKVDRFKPGKGIVVKNANLLASGGLKAATALPAHRREGAFALASRLATPPS